MALVLPIKDGKIVDTSASATTESTVQTKREANNGLDKDAFLQLLVAQMKYQDPLEPTDNTGYISQLATFSQLEATQNLEDSLTQMQASSLVGKQVVLSVTSSATGMKNTVSGVVDYVRYENGKTYLSVNDKLYSIDDLQMVADQDYMDAISIAQAFHNTVAALPSLRMLTIKDADKIKDIREVLDSLTSYQIQFLDEEDVKKFLALEAQMKVLTGNAGDKNESGSEGDNKGDTESTGNSTDKDS